MDEIIPQDLKRNRSNNWCIEDDEEYEENSGRNQYYNSKDKEDDFNSKYQQPNSKHHEYHTDSRRSSVFDSEQYGWTNIPSPKNAGQQIRSLQRKRKQIHEW